VKTESLLLFPSVLNRIRRLDAFAFAPQGVAHRPFWHRSSRPTRFSGPTDRASAALNFDTLSADIILGMQELRFSYTGKALFIKDVLIPEFAAFADAGDLSNICFQAALFGLLDLDVGVPPERLPRFSKCFFSSVEGRSCSQDLPAAIFDEGCLFDEFESGATTRLIGTQG
jgi:hypothetical protein